MDVDDERERFGDERTYFCAMQVEVGRQRLLRAYYIQTTFTYVNLSCTSNVPFFSRYDHLTAFLLPHPWYVRQTINACRGCTKRAAVMSPMPNKKRYDRLGY